MATPAYNADAITVLEGLEPVRTRPGMYIGSTGPTGLHHLVWEVVDNAVDERMAGFGDRIDVTLLADGGCRIRDYGRGIPVDPLTTGPHKGRTAAEVVLTVLHAGGKFGGAGYKVSGGLHGVGVSVVNALASRLQLDIWRDRKQWHQDYAAVVDRQGVIRPGVPQGPLAVVGSAKVGETGTQVTFWPDPAVFDAVDFSARTILERLQTQAYVNRGLSFVFRDERPGREQEVTYRYDGGIRDLVESLNKPKKPLHGKIVVVDTSVTTDHGVTVEVEVAIAWNEGYHEALVTFANGISTVDGGTHAEGFKAAVTRAVNTYARAKSLVRDKDPNLTGDDVREGMTAAVSVRLPDPQFEGQTKGKLGNAPVKTAVQSTTYEALSTWLEENPAEAKAVVAKAAAAMRLRSVTDAEREADKKRRKTGLEGAGLPDKLVDCLGQGIDGTELFIVEGDSAGGTAVRARNPQLQAVFPLRGKPLNVETAKPEAILKNAELMALTTVIGAGRGSTFRMEEVRYSKIVCMADADVDGRHIQLLLLTFFARQMPELVAAGRVYVALPPLFSTEVSGKKLYLRDDAAKAAFLAEHPNHRKPFQRLKGLGEMDFAELRDTVMNPAARRLVRITIEDAAAADRALAMLMGDDADPKWEFICENSIEFAGATLHLAD
jgi:DNA gyrase subunit B